MQKNINFIYNMWYQYNKPNCNDFCTAKHSIRIMEEFRFMFSVNIITFFDAYFFSNIHSFSTSNWLMVNWIESLHTEFQAIQIESSILFQGLGKNILLLLEFCIQNSYKVIKWNLHALDLMQATISE